MRGFATFNPAIDFAFFAGAIILCVLVNDLLFQVIGLVCGASYYFCLRGREAVKVVIACLPVCLLIALVNPLFNMQGETVLFTWLGNRPYTLQALLFGISTSAMFLTVLLWFLCFNEVVTSDKIMYLFGRFAPSITLVFTMVLRLFPSYQRKIAQLNEARSGIGRGAGEGSLFHRVASSIPILSTLVSWALEGSIVTADSMRSRGFDSCKRSRFLTFRFAKRDAIASVCLAALFIVALAAILLGVGSMDYFPTIIVPPASPWAVAGGIAYALFLAAPSIIHLAEAISWSTSLSKI